MKQKGITTVVGIAVVLMAWAFGHVRGYAQTEDSFIITVEVPTGETTLICKKGCNWKNDLITCNAPRCSYSFNQARFTLGNH